MLDRAMRGPAIAAFLVTVSPAHAEPWLERADATGDWGGRRTWLDDHGVGIDLDYTAEGFAGVQGGDAAYRGNVDLVVTLDSHKLGLFPGGTLLVYGQHAHGGGVSDEIGASLPISNLEAPELTQLSELWLEQRLGEYVGVRAGKQDANRDFAGPRFVGNFVNSSFGVIPTVPMPTFPAPAVGGTLLVQPAAWLDVRAGVFEGAPEIESFGETAFSGDGVLGIAALVAQHDVAGRPAGLHTVGAWHHTGTGEAGVFGVADLLLFAAPCDRDDPRSVQVFVRGGWTPDPVQLPELYAGGGVTAHGFLGVNNTIGLGGGWVRRPGGDEAFVEVFFKLRTIPWFTIEPDAQVYAVADRNAEVVVGVRTKLKL